MGITILRITNAEDINEIKARARVGTRGNMLKSCDDRCWRQLEVVA